MGANVHTREKNGYTALMLAVMSDRVSAGGCRLEGRVRVRVSHMAYILVYILIFLPPLHWLRLPSLKTCIFLPSLSYQPNPGHRISHVKAPLPSFLFLFAVAALLDKGADVNSTDSIGCTALHHSIYSGSLLSMALLLSSGANLNLRDDEGLTPLEAAECCGRQEAIEPIKKAVLKVSISEDC